MSDDSIRFLERLRSDVRHRASRLWEPPRTSPPIGRSKLPDGFEIGGALRHTVDEIAACGAELLQLVGTPLSGQVVKLLEELETVTTRVAVVGQIKAGKSSFINALSGRTEFLPTHVNPWTAVPTKLYFGVRNKPMSGGHFEFFSEREWKRLGQTLTGPVVGGQALSEEQSAATARAVWRRALIRLGERYHHLLGEVHRYDTVSPAILSHYLCAGPSVDEPSRTPQAGRYADITRLAHIYLPKEPFASPTILIDTPGLNDPTFIRVKTTQNILEYADVYVVILTASQPLAFTDILLLRRLRGLEKRRLLVFINRVDELDGGLADVEAVERHVRARLRKEFPEAAISVVSGSAFWANAANDGDEAQLRAIAGAPSFRAIAGRGPLHGSGGPEEPGDLETLRSQIFEASGFPELARVLSSAMLSSFLASEGARAINVLGAAAEVSASAARRELKMLRKLAEKAKPRTEVVDFHSGIAQLDRRLRSLSEARDTVAALIEASRAKIQAICDSQGAVIRNSIANRVDAYAAEQKKLLIRQSEELKKARWRCDTTELLKQLETDFLRLFTGTIKEIAGVHDECVGAVRAAIEQQHAEPNRPLDTHKVIRPDIRAALPALGSIIEVEIGQPWWLSWWGSSKTAAEKAAELEAKILQEFKPISQRLVSLALEELARFAGHARETISAVAASTIGSTSARLHDLRERLLRHSRQEASKQHDSLDKDYARIIRDLTELIARCEAISDRLRRLGAAPGS